MGWTHKQFEEAKAERDRAKATVDKLNEALKHEEDPWEREEIVQELNEAISYYRGCCDYVDDIVIDRCSLKPL